MTGNLDTEITHRLCFRRAIWCLVLSSFLLSYTACSRSSVRHEEVTTEQVSSGDTPAAGENEGYSSSTRREESTTTQESSSGSSCSGVLSCAVHAVGEVLAFPFRAIGYVFQAIF